jgi:glycosyltransferase involved in cell wall biosynthesis
VTGRDVLVVGADDPFEAQPGGWQTIVTAFIRSTGEASRYAVAGPGDEATGAWSTRVVGSVEIPYFTLRRVAGPLGSKRLGAVLALVRYRRRLGQPSLVYSHGPELLLPFLLMRRRPRLVLHVLGDLGNEVSYARRRELRASFLRRAYIRFAYAVMRRCELVLWVDTSKLAALPADIASRSEALSTFFDDRVFRVADASARDVPPLLLTVSRLTVLKRTSLLVQALGRLPGCRLAICGRGPEEESLRRLADELGVGDRIEWHTGYLEAPELAALIARSSVGLLVSASEGSPAVVKEMLAVGVPVVVSDVGDNNRVVRRGENGEVLADPDAEAIAASVERLLALELEPRAVAGTVAQDALSSWVSRLERALD